MSMWKYTTMQAQDELTAKSDQIEEVRSLVRASLSSDFFFSFFFSSRFHVFIFHLYCTCPT